MPQVVLVSELSSKFDAAVELKPLLEAFAAKKVPATVAAWDDPTFDWSRADVAVLRCTWNYHHRLSDFLAFTRRVPRLLNPPEVVAWNAKKTYLRELEREGLPIVPTRWLSAETPLDTLLQREGWSEAVLKPSVSAGAFRTARFDAKRPPKALLTEILASGCEAMVQPYLPSVEGYGERSLIYLGGRYSHAVRRSPALSTGDLGGKSAEAASDERTLAERVLGRFEPLAYARVDLAKDERGQLRLMELELIEPALFLYQQPGSAERLVEAVLSRC